MLSVLSIIAFFAQIALVNIGILGTYAFIKRFFEVSRKRYFYGLIVVGFLIGATIQGLFAFLTNTLHILQLPNIALISWRYILMTAPLFNLIHWASMVYLFTGRKNV